MIKIESNRRDGLTDLQIEVGGDVVDIGVEAAHILARLPKDLEENAYDAFLVMRMAFNEIADGLKKEHSEEEGAANDKRN